MTFRRIITSGSGTSRFESATFDRTYGSRLSRDPAAGPPTERHFSHTGMAHRFGRSSATLGRPAALSADSRGRSSFRMLTRRLNDLEPRSRQSAPRRRRGRCGAGGRAAAAQLLGRCARAAGLRSRCRSRPTLGSSESRGGTRRLSRGNESSSGMPATEESERKDRPRPARVARRSRSGILSLSTAD